SSHAHRRSAHHDPTFFSAPLAPPPRCTLFPYTTLFRSVQKARAWPAMRLRPSARSRSSVAGFSSSRARRTTTIREPRTGRGEPRSEEHTSELQSRSDLVCRLLLEKKKNKTVKRSQQKTH